MKTGGILKDMAVKVIRTKEEEEEKDIEEEREREISSPQGRDRGIRKPGSDEKGGSEWRADMRSEEKGVHDKIHGVKRKEKKQKEQE